MKSVSKLLFASLLALALTGCVGGYYEYGSGGGYYPYSPYGYGVSVGHFDGGHHGHWGGGGHDGHGGHGGHGGHH